MYVYVCVYLTLLYPPSMTSNAGDINKSETVPAIIPVVMDPVTNPVINIDNSLLLMGL